MYYKVVLSGNNIYFENTSVFSDSSTPDPIIGFISCQLIETTSEDLAIAKAKRDLLVNWNQSFNADRKMGMPKLHLEHIGTVSRWSKPKIKHDYYWFANDAHKQEHIEKFTREKKRWYWFN